jgi:hypothetical protein
MVMDEKNVAEEHDEAWEIADDIYVERITRSRGAAAIRAYRDRAVNQALLMEHEVTKQRIEQAVAETKARAEAAEAKVKTLASLINSDVVASMSTPEGLQPINSTEMRYAVDKWDSAEAKVRELEKHLSEARAENANDSTMKHFMAELNRLRIESLDTQLDSAVAKIKELEAKLAATEDWESRYRAAISCMKRVLENQFADNLPPGSPAHLYADAIVAGIARLRLELIRKQCVIDKFREATRGL